MKKDTNRNKSESVSLRKQLDCYAAKRIIKKMAERSVIIVNLPFMEGMSHFIVKGSVNLP